MTQLDLPFWLRSPLHVRIGQAERADADGKVQPVQGFNALESEVSGNVRCFSDTIGGHGKACDTIYY